MVDLKNLVDISLLQGFQDNFSLSAGFSCLTEDSLGNALTCPSHFSDCCLNIIRKSKQGAKRCRNCDLMGAEDAIRKGKPAIYQCHAGLIDFAVPIIVEGKQIGTIYGGQVLAKPPNEEKFRKIALEMGVNPDEYVAAIKKIPVLPEEIIHAAANTLFLVATTFSETAYRKLKFQAQNRDLVLVNSRLNNVLKTISEGVLIVDEKGSIIQTNKMAEQIFARPVSELMNHTLQEIIKGEKPANFSKSTDLQKFYSDLEHPLDTTIDHIHCHSSSQPIYDDRGIISGRVIILHPMRKHHHSVRQLNRKNAKFQIRDFIGESPALQETKRIALLAAKSMSNVLIEGESGTGKEIIAQAIHNASNRRNGPFVAINCGAIPSELISSELFGYAEGAFTGAKRGGSPGKFERASGGTIFLDEIGDMPIEQQVVLLRVLQEKQVIRIGGESTIAVDTRIICATNKQLQDEIAQGSFRQDLYYRINVFSISIPPLRDRPEDIPLLFHHFAKIMSQKSNKSYSHIEPGLIECLQQYSWPGNVRELQNVVERMVNIADGDTVRLQHFPDYIIGSKENLEVPKSTGHSIMNVSHERKKWRKTIADRESQIIQELLVKRGGNVSGVARDMGISRNTLYRKMKQYNIN